jgi:hypothetical protein
MEKTTHLHIALHYFNSGISFHYYSRLLVVDIIFYTKACLLGQSVSLISMQLVYNLLIHLFNSLFPCFIVYTIISSAKCDFPFPVQQWVICFRRFVVDGICTELN